MRGKEKAEPHASSDNRHPTSKSSGAKLQKKAAKDVSNALRSVYDDTLREEIPEDLRDLLGKLQ